MYENVKGKRLLVLGSNPKIAGMVKTAQSMGIYVVVTDNRNYKDAPAKQIADEYADISFADFDQILCLMREKHIDGVLTGFVDSYLEYYLKICEKAGLPCYGDAKTFGIATDKMLFKNACSEAGVPTIPGVNAYHYEEAVAFAQKTGFPLMLKPADNSGSRGVIKCEALKDLKQAYEYALSFSPTKNVICEKFMDCDGIGISYQLIDGEAYLSSICDRSNYCASGDGSSITADLLYPSEYTARYIAEMDLLVKRMLKANGFKHGMVSLQSFVDTESFYMCEMCYRPSGGHHYHLIQDQNDVDSLKLLIEYAVTGKVCNYTPGRDTPYFKDVCALMHIIGVPEQEIETDSGFDDVKKMEGVIAVVKARKKGDIIGKDGTTAQVLGSVWFKADGLQQLEEKYHAIHSLLKYENHDGESLILQREFAAQKAKLFKWRS